jgi:Acetamidase/Formamidase family
VDAGGWYGTIGVGPNLYAAAQDAVRAMVDHLTDEYDLSREDAYVLSSLCVDLRISEVVDAGQYVISALLPLCGVYATTGLTAPLSGDEREDQDDEEHALNAVHGDPDQCAPVALRGIRDDERVEQGGRDRPRHV